MVLRSEGFEMFLSCALFSGKVPSIWHRLFNMIRSEPNRWFKKALMSTTPLAIQSLRARQITWSFYRWCGRACICRDKTQPWNIVMRQHQSSEVLIRILLGDYAKAARAITGNVALYHMDEIHTEAKSPFGRRRCFVDFFSMLSLTCLAGNSLDVTRAIPENRQGQIQPSWQNN